MNVIITVPVTVHCLSSIYNSWEHYKTSPQLYKLQVVFKGLIAMFYWNKQHGKCRTWVKKNSKHNDLNHVLRTSVLHGWEKSDEKAEVRVLVCVYTALSLVILLTLLNNPLLHPHLRLKSFSSQHSHTNLQWSKNSYCALKESKQKENP